MIWKLIDRAVQLTFLLLAVVLITTILKNDKYTSDLKGYSERLDYVTEKQKQVVMNNTAYLEERINRVQSLTDSFQNSTTSRMNVLEARIQRIDGDQRDKSPNVNINQNYNNNH